MHIHILGICGTFMAGVAQLAKQAGHRVTGADEAVYPPMSDIIAASGIDVMQGYDACQLIPRPDCVVVGNAITRGNPVFEAVLNQRIPYQSGPAWLAQHILQDKWVLAATGTHGKTTLSSMMTWILTANGYNPGYLIGGVPVNLNQSAQLTDAPWFVIEGDEYDTALFDKRSKFIHYQPKTLVINNLEFDHADIFADLAAIQQQFHHLVRTIASQGLIVTPVNDVAIEQVLARGCWTPITTVGLGEGNWSAQLVQEDGSAFEVFYQQAYQGRVQWPLLGLHNVSNALTAIAACHHAQVAPADSIAALNTFRGVKRRLEVKGQVNNITVYDDFAHHPTAIAATLQGLRRHVERANIIVLIEPGSYTMRHGIHQHTFVNALAAADCVICFNTGDWCAQLTRTSHPPIQVLDSVSHIVEQATQVVQPGDHIVIMSNRGFGGIHDKLLQALAKIN
ncbi:MAG: UDP-N-acetylmuramate:L-alanyl-gamma-D-glutamyl-meso-diaminopimelate ligase [Legionellales bacterium]|nr:UDP-N-acetylmuramate:L-alanyl-gamma-D-glutamyl-meso-diaminopimelate ligase [Legionellales bacterium]